MKIKSRRIQIFAICILLLMSPLVTLVGCTQNGDDTANGNGFTGEFGLAMGRGRFVETEIILPEEMGTIIDMVWLEDGNLRIIDSRGILFDSFDDGETWERSELQFGLFLVDGGVVSAALSSNGGAFLSLMPEHIYMNSAGETTLLEMNLPAWRDSELTIDGEVFEPIEFLARVRFTSDHQILGISRSILCLIEPSTGEILHTFGEDGERIIFLDYIQIHNQLFALTKEGIDIYNLETGRLMEPDPILHRHFIGKEIPFMGAELNWHRFRILPVRGEDAFYIFESSGLYRYTIGGSQLEQLINGSLTTMGNPAYGIGAVVEKDNNRFMISYVGIGDNRQRLIRYTFDPEAETVPSQEMVVFTLFDNPAIRQAISVFQTRNTHLLVRYEVGMPLGNGAGEHGVTLSDVISTLNTRILAGDGPDILFLDGLPYEAYMESGVLLDLSEVIDELREENEFFENILEVKEFNGRLYVVPIFFFLPMEAGPPELLEGMSTLSDLADTVERLREMEENPHIDIIGAHTGESLMNTLIHYSYYQLVDEDRALNQEVLRSFLEDSMRIFQVNSEADGDAISSGANVAWETSALASREHNINDGFIGALLRTQPLNVGVLTHFYDFDSLLAIHQSISWDYQVRNSFIPVDLFGINKNSDFLEESKDFLRLLLSPETQSRDQFAGFPVNLAGFYWRKSVAGEGYFGAGSISEDGEIVMVVVSKAQIRQLERLMDEIRGLERASSPNRIVMEVILDEGVPFLNGEQSLEEALEGIVRRVNLFLME